MSKLGDRIENALNEDRILLLGGQVLLGFSYRPYFEASFQRMDHTIQISLTAAVGIMTLGLVWLLRPAPFHQIIEGGEDTERIHRLTTSVLDWALLPFASALGILGYVICSFIGIRAALPIGVGVALFAAIWWYVFPLSEYETDKRSRVREELKAEEEKQQLNGGTELKEKIKKLLIECRMVLPGVQALLGFQLTTYFMQGFDSLPVTSKWIHFGGLAATALATVLIITPAAYHRLAEAGEDTDRFHKVGSCLLLGSMLFLGIGLHADLIVILRKIGMSLPWSSFVGLMLLIGSYSLWFGSFLVVSKRN